MITSVLVGEDDAGRECDRRAGLAPRLGYRLLADQCNGRVITCFPAPSALQGWRIFRVLRSMAANFLQAAQIVRSIPLGSTVYSTGETWGLPVALVSGLLGRRRFAHVVRVHALDSSAWQWTVHTLRPLLHVDRWVCLTRYQADLMSGALGLERDGVAVVAEGVDSAFFDPHKAKTPAGYPGYVLAAGKEMREYGLLFGAVRDLDIRVVAKVSSCWTTVPRARLPAAPQNVTLLTHRLSWSEIRDLYAGASLVVVPVQDTLTAAGMNVVLEAMSMRKAVIVTRTRGLSDVVADGFNGLVAEPSAPSLAKAIVDLTQSPREMGRLAANGRQSVQERFSLERHAESTAALLRSA